MFSVISKIGELYFGQSAHASVVNCNAAASCIYTGNGYSSVAEHMLCIQEIVVSAPGGF